VTDRSVHTGRTKTYLQGQQIAIKTITNDFVDALEDFIAVQSGNKAELSPRSKALLEDWGRNPQKIDAGLQALPEMPLKDKVQLLRDLERVFSRGHHIRKTTYVSADPTQKVSRLIEGGAMRHGSKNTIQLFGADSPLLVKFTDQSPLTNPTAMIKREDHTVVVFGGDDPQHLLALLKIMSPDKYWSPSDPAAIQTRQSPFHTDVQVNPEGNGLTPFITLLGAQNKLLTELVALGSDACSPRRQALEMLILNNQIALGLYHSQHFEEVKDDKKTNPIVFAHFQHTALEVQEGRLAEAISALSNAGLSTLPAPQDPKKYYGNVTKSAFTMLLPQVLQALGVESDLGDFVAGLSNYGFEINDEIFAALVAANKLEGVSLEKAQAILKAVNAIRAVFAEVTDLSDRQSLVSQSVGVLEERMGVSLTTENKIQIASNFERILETLATKIEDAKVVGHFLEFVVKFDPKSLVFEGGLLSQTFTYPLAHHVGRFTQWVELIERQCFEGVTLGTSHKRGCSLFGGGKIQAPGTENNFISLIKGVDAVVEITKGRKMMPLDSESALKKDPLVVLRRQLEGGYDNDKVMQLPKGQLIQCLRADATEVEKGVHAVWTYFQQVVAHAAIT